MNALRTQAAEIICASVGEGARDSGCKLGPEALVEAGIVDHVSAGGRKVHLGAMVRSRPEEAEGRLATVAAFAQALAAEVRGAMLRGYQPLVLGGDHSCAIGTWSGVADAVRARGGYGLGLVWIDAHLDAHTGATSPSQAPHGMPLAALLGFGDRALTDVLGFRRKVDAAHVVVVGARSYEAGEQALLESLGVRVMYMDEVTRRGLRSCLAEAVDVAKAAGAWGMTLDVDALDPADFAGTGSPEPDGIRLAEAVAALHGVAGGTGFQAMELCEYNPLRDYRGASARAAGRLLRSVYGSVPADSGTHAANFCRAGRVAFHSG